MKLPLTIALLLVVSPAGAANPWSLGAELGATYDDNAGNAGSAADQRAVERIGAGANATYTIPFSSFTALQLRGALDGEGVAGLSQLSFGRAGARIRLLCKPGEDFYVPVLATSVSGDYRESASSLRSGDEVRIGAYLSEPVTTKVSARLGFGWSRRDSVSRVFDGQNRAYELSVDWAVLPQLSVYGEYRLDDGPIVVTAQGGGVITPKTEHLTLQGAADAIEPDPAFGDGWWAFRVNARTGIATLGATLPLTKDVSIDAQLRRAHATVTYNSAIYSGGGGPGPGGGATYGSPGYDRWLGGVSLLLRF